MPVPRRFRPGYGERMEQQRQRFAVRNGKVFQYVKEHPLETAEQIFKATGFGVSNNPYIKAVRYEGKTVYRVNTEKQRRQGFE